MVFSHHYNLSRLEGWISRRTKELPTGFKKFCGSTLSRFNKARFQGALYFFASLVLGAVAYHYSTQEAIDTWEKTYLPSEPILTFALGSRGLQKITSEVQLQKTLRSLPTNLDEKGAFWMSTSGGQNEPQLKNGFLRIWIAVFLDSSLGIQPIAFCKDLTSSSSSRSNHRFVPTNWQPIGRGWKGLDQVLEKIDAELSQWKTIKSAPSKRILPDPREIRY